MPFDRDSGQVFKETVLPRNELSSRETGSFRDRDWSRQMRHPLKKCSSVRGPHSLVVMSIHVVAENIGQVTEQHLLALPPKLMWRVWKLFEVQGTSLQAWRLFSKIAIKTDELTMGLYWFRHHVERLSGELRQYTQPLTSLSAEFITHLVISGDTAVSAHELLCLTEIKNLGVLEIIKPRDYVPSFWTEVTDRLVRGWVESEDPFPLLRLLRLWGCEGMTKKSLPWVSRLPSLAIYDVVGTREYWQDSESYAAEHGWESADPGSSSDDSLLWFVMDLVKLMPAEASRLLNIHTLARNIKSDLALVCCRGSEGALELVPHGEAPKLCAYLTDTRIAVPQSSRVPSDWMSWPWAFWLYSFAGQSGNDQDFKRRGLALDTQVVLGPFVLPSRPFASLQFGCIGGTMFTRPCYVLRERFSMKRITFTRPNPFGRDGLAVNSSAATTQQRTQVAEGTRTPKKKPAMEPAVRPQKRVKMDDLLSSLGT